VVRPREGKIFLWAGGGGARTYCLLKKTLKKILFSEK
jgi:hypothetical protein